jgi:superfamily II DNA or RNA helicase
MIPKIRVGNVMAHIECDRNHLVFLDNELSVEVPGAFWAKQHRPGWDGKWHPLHLTRQTFPTGLVPRVNQLLPACEIIDERVRPEVIPFNRKILQGIELADHQVESCQLFLYGAEMPGRGILATSVGSGKTEDGIAIGCHVHGQCVWITHRKDIFHQTAERIQWRTGEVPAMIGDGGWDEDLTGKKFVLAMPQTVLKDLKHFHDQVKDATSVIVDEAHTASAAETWFKAVQAIPAYFKCGLTGTPEVGDEVRERRLEAATGPVLIRIKSSDMAKIGWTVPCEIIYHKMFNEAVHGADYREARRVLIEENPERNAMVVQLAMEAALEGKRCLVICDTKKHLRIIGDVLRGENVRSLVLHGQHNSTMRSKAKKDIRTGALEVLLTTPIFDMGVDIPELEVVIIAAGGKSASRFVQRCGRALRTSKGKSVGTIHDFFDTGSRWTIRHSRDRMKAAQDEGFKMREVNAMGPRVPRV